MAVNFYRNRARMAFIFGGAVAAYALRLLSYHALVLPSARHAATVVALWNGSGAGERARSPTHAPAPPAPAANAWSDEVCGTDKAISGHAYYFVFHVLLWGVGYLQFCQPRRGGPKARPHRVQKRKANAKKSGGPEISAEELLHFVAGVGYFVAAVCAYLSLTTTYTEGFHSARCAPPLFPPSSTSRHSCPLPVAGTCCAGRWPRRSPPSPARWAALLRRPL